ncbi:DUF3164 family protein [Tistrella bauzanensis]|uniref:DUF3164 family protein n=1 Tax=Tistrella TaxID=171436 RepID=UPI0031F66FF3
MTDVTTPEGYMKDSKGRLVPLDLVRPADSLEDQAVRKILGYAEDLSAQIARFRAHTMDDVDALVDILREQYGAKPGGQKGNLTLTSYDGTQKVQVAVSDTIAFGPELEAARSLIDECVSEWSADAAAPIRALVEHAFVPDRAGVVNREALLRLRKVDIDDDRWRRAMTAITDAIRVQGSKTYIRLYRRDRPTDRWRMVPIDIASA